jgi:uncharacterized membrane protein
LTHVQSSSQLRRNQRRIDISSIMTGRQHRESQDIGAGFNIITVMVILRRALQMTRDIPLDTVAGKVVFRIKHKFRQRIVEWVCAAQIALFGLILMDASNTFGQSNNFVWMSSIMSEPAWAYSLFVIGTGRIIGLIINGSMESVTPWIRTFGAFCGLFVFGMITTSMLYAAFVLRSPPAAGISMYSVAFCAEVAAIYCAVIDARIYENGRRIRKLSRSSGS